jgi:dephospho-CoA kinase
MVLKVGITGGIGSGKSTVAKIFELLQIPVYYADAASKKLYQTNERLKSAIKMHFGEDVYAGDQLNRSRLAALVFDNSEKLHLLNSLVHPLTIEDAEQWMQAQTATYVLKEAALIFESGSAAMLDFVIGVQAPVHLRIKRVMDREGISREAVLQRMDRQIDESIKMRLCDFIIHNNEQELIIPQVLKLDSTLRQIASSRA